MLYRCFADFLPAGISGSEVPDAISVIAANLLENVCRSSAFCVSICAFLYHSKVSKKSTCQGCFAVAISSTVMPSDLPQAEV